MKMLLLSMMFLVLAACGVESESSSELAGYNKSKWVCSYEGSYRKFDGDRGTRPQVYTEHFTGIHPKDEDNATFLAYTSCHDYFKHNGISQYQCKFTGCEKKKVNSNSGNDTWYSSKFDRHYNKNGQCRQYNNTNARTCETKKDNLDCSWNSSRNQCKG